jgi:hypothetical protein
VDRTDRNTAANTQFQMEVETAHLVSLIPFFPHPCQPYTLLSGDISIGTDYCRRRPHLFFYNVPRGPICYHLSREVKIQELYTVSVLFP